MDGVRSLDLRSTQSHVGFREEFRQILAGVECQTDVADIRKWRQPFFMQPGEIRCQRVGEFFRLFFRNSGNGDGKSGAGKT